MGDTMQRLAVGPGRCGGLALMIAGGLSGCARPCVDDGFLSMQHDKACIVATDTTGGGTTTGESTGAATSEPLTTDATTGEATDCSCPTGEPTTGTSSTGAVVTDTGESTIGESTTGDSTGDSTTTGSTTGDASSESSSGSTTSEAVCGNGAMEGSEECDDGANNGTTKPCTPDCTVNVCGDGGANQGVEFCDDGNGDDLDGCNNACKPNPTQLLGMPANMTVFEGGPGGNYFDDICSGQGVLVGYVGQVDAMGRIGALSGVCAPLLVESNGMKLVVKTGTTSNLLPRGMGASGPWESLCADGHAVVGFRGQESTAIDQLVIRCAPVDLVPGGDGTYTVALGAAVELPVVGTNMNGTPFGAVDCFPGQVGVRQVGFADVLIDAMALGCGDLVLALF